MAPRTQADGNIRLEWAGLAGDILDSTVQVAILAFREPYLRINDVMAGESWKGISGRTVSARFLTLAERRPVVLTSAISPRPDRIDPAASQAGLQRSVQ